MIKKLFFMAALLMPGLAYGANPTAGLSVQIVPAGTCQPGNHGPVRGRPHIANGTLVADDGCMLRGSAAFQDLAGFQASRDNGHYNIMRDAAFIGCWYGRYPCSPEHTLQDNLNEIDQGLALAGQTGMYYMITYFSGPTDNEWANTRTFWQTVAARYANNTNVIYELHNEVDFYSEPYTNIGADETSMFQLMRSLAPNTPIVTYSLECITCPDSRGYGLLKLISEGPTMDANTVFGFHMYESDVNGIQNAINTLRQAGIPSMMTEYGYGYGQFAEKIGLMESLGISWQEADGWQVLVPNGVSVTWPLD